MLRRDSMKRSCWFLVLSTATALGASLTLAQRFSGRSPDRDRPVGPPDRQGLPTWEVAKEFQHDAFTFVRIHYVAHYGYRGRGAGPGFGRGFGRGGFGHGDLGRDGYDLNGRALGSWAIDYPDADLNIAYRLHQLTSIEVNPDGLVLDLTDPELCNYPFIYMNPGDPIDIVFTDEEVSCLRKYLLNGGFLFVTDFWGQDEWEDFNGQMKRVFPDREPVELTIDHPIFHCVFDLKKKPQIPSIQFWMRSPSREVTWERWNRSDTKEPHYMAYEDDKGRIVALICYNCDLSDGWEREGDNEEFFREFSETLGYPMGINMIFYAMTH
jgi:hypothetical protein